MLVRKRIVFIARLQTGALKELRRHLRTGSERLTKVAEVYGGKTFRVHREHLLEVLQVFRRTGWREPHCLVPVAVSETHRGGHRVVDHPNRIRVLSFGAAHDPVPRAHEEDRRGHIAFVVGGDNGRTIEARRIERARGVSKMVIDGHEPSLAHESLFDHSPRSKTLLESIQTVYKVWWELLDWRSSRQLSCARGLKCDFAMKQLVRFQIVCDAVEIVEFDAAAFEAEVDGALRESAGVIHADVAYAGEFLFFDGCYNAPVLNERGSRVSLLSGDAKNIHLVIRSIVRTNTYHKHSRL